MLETALIIFAVAAIGGIVLALHVLRDKFAPWAVSIIHALLGASGLVVLLIAVAKGIGGSLAMMSLSLFVVAALGGFYLALTHLRQKLPAKVIVLAHASLAIIAFGVLLAVVLNVA